MSDSIVRVKIREALSAAGNNRHDAHKLLLTWAVRDPSLLLALTKPHLKAIAAGWVDHYVRQRDAVGEGEEAEEGARTAIDDVVAAAAMRLPRDKRKQANIPPPKSTERQASAMRKLAAAFTKKKH